MQDEKNVALKKDCASANCAGTRDSAKYQIKLPADKKKWNGTLVIYSHGYRNAVPIPNDPLDPAKGESPGRHVGGVGAVGHRSRRS